MISADEALRGSPYVPPDGEPADRAFARVAERSAKVAAQARSVQEKIAQDASEVLGPYLRAQRGELVAESSQIESINVTRDQVLQAVLAHEELIDGAVHGLLQAMRADRKLVATLGLYKAQTLADEWAHNGQRLRAYEVRQLHMVLVGDDRIGGAYRTRDVSIGGTTFRPPGHYNVQYAMDAFADWWTTSHNDPVLDATIAHAWLTHIHPFEDGNGRLARVLANFVLTEAAYPPLIIRSDADRGEYFDALAASDDGNILPLYKLFATIIRRTVRAMARPGYTHDFLENRLLASISDQYNAWRRTVEGFERQLRARLEMHGWGLLPQGMPDKNSFQLLADRNSDGNGWFAAVADPRGQRRFLLWFGYSSNQLCDALEVSSEGTGYPSLFLSARDDTPHAPHPYRAKSRLPGLPDEIFVKPLEAAPVLLRQDYDVRSLTMTQATDLIADAFARQ